MVLSVVLQYIIQDKKYMFNDGRITSTKIHFNEYELVCL